MRRANTTHSNSTKSDDLSDAMNDEKVLVYNFKANRLSAMSRRELGRKAGESLVGLQFAFLLTVWKGDIDNISSIRVPALSGRLTIRLRDSEEDPDTYIATVDIRWQWRWQRLAGNLKELYIAGSL